MINAIVSGIGWVNANGMGRGFVQLPPASTSPTYLPKIKGRDLFEEPNNRFGRLDTFSKIGFAGVTQALRDAAIEADESLRHTGIIAVTEHGCTETDINYFNTVIPDNGKLCSPNIFAYTLSSCFVGEISIFYKLFGECYVLNGGLAIQEQALRQALLNIMDGTHEHMIVGLNDTWSQNFCSRNEPPLLGSVFITISKSTYANIKSYGPLTLHSDSSVSFKGKAIKSILEIATH